jgi:type I restriction enzyme S subunit
VQIGFLADPEPGSFKIGPFGSSLKKDELVNEGIPVVGIENILPNKFVSCFRRFIAEEKFQQLSQYLIKSGDILVTTMGTIGRAAVVPDNAVTAIIDSHLFRMRVDRAKVDPQFLCYAINGHPGIIEEIKAKSSGAIMAGLNTKILKSCKIDLPAIPEQKRIAAILNDQIGVVNLASAAAQVQLENARALPAAYLRQVFPDSGQQLPHRWRWVRLGEVAKLERGKFTPRPRNDPRYFGGPYPWIQIGEVESARKYVSTYRTTLNEDGLRVSKLFPKGTLVISIAATIGAVGILSFDACMPDSLVAIRLWLAARTRNTSSIALGF